VDRRKHERALAILRTLKQNDRVEIEAIDHHAIHKIITRQEAKETTRNEPLTNTTIGYYQWHDRDYTLLSADKLDDEDERAQFNVVLTKYVIRVTRLKRK